MYTDHNKLWDYAVAFYSQDTVAELCLTLQDEFAQDVPLLLFLCWHGQQLGHIDDATLRASLELSRRWQDELVAPLRRSRRWLKVQLQEKKSRDAVGLKQLRESIKASELESERLQLAELESLALEKCSETQAPRRSGEAIAANLQQLMAINAAETGTVELNAKLEQLVTAASRFAQSD